MHDREAIFRIAWGMARVGAMKFGGSPREYFAASLRISWRDQQLMPPAMRRAINEEVKPRRPTRQTFEEGRDRLMKRPRLDRGKHGQRIGGKRGREWYVSGAGW